MKHLLKFSAPLTVLLTLAVANLQAQEMADSTGLPGDHFSLQGALELFKKAQSPEDFESLLNQEENHVNNLDLNGDGDIDYVRVIDNQDEDAHAIVLQAIVAKDEFQDIAVIEIEKDGDESAILQIIGDEDIYGENVIVEPFEEEDGDDGKGPRMTEETVRIVVNVWGWPSVRFVYAPGYRVWVSPWYWGYYPRAWRPWRPHPFRVFWPRTTRYHMHYHVVGVHRVTHAHRVYTPVRRTSVKVTRTHSASVTKYRADRGVTVNKSTTGVKYTGARGNTVSGKRSNTTVEYHGKNRDVKATRTTKQGKVQKNNGGTVKGKKSTTRVKTKRH
jgi:hypothetical protein